ncbi:MAG: hypothetical protein CVU11_13215 [Bacteroidetes bacterium HGW-Bacteroidetes-6]|jgi:hypothetical protein|nr:MAG: hypothetical protein CVU11_13215 [Bacteroidetes bacterium HGW-Bacteroidetes-6]
MIEGTVNGKAFKVPESFEEFSNRHWKLFMRVMTDYRAATWHDVRLKFIMKLIKFPVRKLVKLSLSKDFWDQEEYEEHMSQITVFSERLKYFDDPKISTTRNVFPVVRRGIFRRNLYGPADNLANLETWEYAIAEIKAISYSETNNKQFLDELFAVLYRHRKPFWLLRKYFGASPSDPRQQFHDENIASYLKKSRRVGKYVKLYTYFFFQSVRSTFPDQFKDLYKVRKSTGEARETNWSDTIVAFTGTTPGDEEKTGRTNILWMLKRMNHLAHEADEMEAKNKENKHV